MHTTSTRDGDMQAALDALRAGRAQEARDLYLRVIEGGRADAPVLLGVAHVKIEAATGLVWDPWGEVINKVLQPNELNRCYRAHGTTLNRLWDNNCQ